jgi:hypothetical protein
MPLNLFVESINLNLARSKIAPKIFLFVTDNLNKLDPVRLASKTLFLLLNKGLGPLGVWEAIVDA